MDIRFERNGIYVDIEVCENGQVVLWNCFDQERPRTENSKWYPLVELQGSGYNHNDHHGSKHTLCGPGSELRYESHSLTRNDQGDLFLQSRGHYLHGGGRERQYNLFKSWASLHEKAFYEVLSDRFVMYGEWMYAKHTVFYDALPDYFMEFDIYDRERGVFLSTSERRKMTERLPMVHSVPVLGEGSFRKKENVLSFIGRSNYITDNHIEALRASAVKLGLDPDEQCRSVDPSGIMEGLYVKMEESGTVVGRFKYVRASFLQSRLENANDWHHRVILPNKLKGEYK